MASLQNAQIDQSYQGLIKTANNQAGAPFPPAALQYGDGTNLPISLGDGSGIGLGDMITISSGTRSVNVNAQDASITGLTAITAASGTAQIFDGTFNFGVAAPGPATTVDFSNATVTGLPASGGATPPMDLISLPAQKGDTFGYTQSYRTHVATNGYGTASVGTQNVDRGQIAVIPMGEGWEINYIITAISSAVASALGRIAIYDLEIDADGHLVVGTKLRDVGTFDASTTGFKKLDISANPFVMPAGKTYGAVALVFGTDTSGVAYTSWSQPIWSGNGGATNNDTTWYRRVAWSVQAAGQNLGTTMPTSLASGTYLNNTSNPIWMGVNA